jgi:uncharacterized protein
MGAFRFSSSIPNLASSGSAGEMYGYLSLPSIGQKVEHGVLLCNPFGQEAVRCHRMYRVLSESLARAGVACLRFDYIGSGDSDGEDHDLTIQTCVQNTLTADQELRRLAGCAHVSWLGLRLGAAIAARSSTLAVLKPDRLFLWDPIAEGRAWIQQLKLEHMKAVTELADNRPRWKPFLKNAQAPRSPVGPLKVRQSLSDTSDLSFESQGFVVSAKLHHEIASIGPEQYADSRCARLIVLATDSLQRQSLSELESAKHLDSFEMLQVEPAYWNNDEAISSAIVARDVVSLVVQEMAGGGR